jgi:hypothetical protein
MSPPLSMELNRNYKCNKYLKDRWEKCQNLQFKSKSFKLDHLIEEDHSK